MQTQTLVVSFALLVALLVAAAGLTRLSRLPAPTCQFLLGALAAHGVVAMGIDTGLRYQNFHDLVFYLFLPILIFAAAYSIEPRKLRELAIPVTGLAGPGLLIASSLIAVILYYGIGHPAGFPWHAALLAGVLLAATDPAAVTSQNHGAAHPRVTRLNLVLEGESLFNDASAVVLYTVVLTLAVSLSTGTTTDIGNVWVDGGIIFAQELAGGLLAGALFALPFLLLRRFRIAPLMRTWLALSASLLAYHAALALHASGVVACLVCGLVCAALKRDEEDAHYWDFAAQTSTGILFLLMGATVTVAMFEERWLAMLIGIGAVLLARLVAVVCVLRTSARHTLDLRDTLLVGALGLRGSITLALVLILPTELPYWWTVQSIAYGVVLFDLFVLAPLAPHLIQRLLRA